MRRRSGLLTLLVVPALMGCGLSLPTGKASPLTPGTTPLVQARKSHPTQLTQRGPSPQQYDQEVPPGVERVTFGRSGLFAWIDRPAGVGPHPAVLWAHGGFALGAGDFEDVRPFVNAGFVVMTPAWRGENGNPGSFEMYYGEVDDACDALNYLAKLRDVDPHRLYVAGHSAGGTIAALTAESSPRVKAAAAVGATADLRGAVERFRQPLFEGTPYDWRNAAENDLRSPARHLNDLRCPLALYYGSEEGDLIGIARPMERYAGTFGKEVTLEVIPGADHFGAVGPAVQKMIALFSR